MQGLPKHSLAINQELPVQFQTTLTPGNQAVPVWVQAYPRPGNQAAPTEQRGQANRLYLSWHQPTHVQSRASPGPRNLVESVPGQAVRMHLCRNRLLLGPAIRLHLCGVRLFLVPAISLQMCRSKPHLGPTIRQAKPF